MRRRAVTASLLFVLLLTSYSRAWSAAGHTVIGAIAYDVLKKEHPDELVKILTLLRQHPTYETVLKAKENRFRQRTAIATSS